MAMTTDQAEQKENDRLNKLIALRKALKGEQEATIEELPHVNRIKYATTLLLDYPHKTKPEIVEMIMQQFDVGLTTAYAAIKEAQEIYPSIEEVNKAFARAHLIREAYFFLVLCREKKNTRDAKLYIKELRELFELDKEGQEAKDTRKVVNFISYSPALLGTPLPEDFDPKKFIADLEKEYNQKPVDGE